jgi:UDP-N-acetylglucosamine:LPS N-acetylglucosamine transferase
MNGRRLFEEILSLNRSREEVARLGEAARQFAKPGAAERAAEVLEEYA